MPGWCTVTRLPSMEHYSWALMAVAWEWRNDFESVPPPPRGGLQIFSLTLSQLSYRSSANVLATKLILEHSVTPLRQCRLCAVQHQHACHSRPSTSCERGPLVLHSPVRKRPLTTHKQWECQWGRTMPLQNTTLSHRHRPPPPHSRRLIMSPVELTLLFLRQGTAAPNVHWKMWAGMTWAFFSHDKSRSSCTCAAVWQVRIELTTLGLWDALLPLCWLCVLHQANRAACQPALVFRKMTSWGGMTRATVLRRSLVQPATNVPAPSLAGLCWQQWLRLSSAQATGLVVEHITAMDVTGARFPHGALWLERGGVI